MEVEKFKVFIEECRRRFHEKLNAFTNGRINDFFGRQLKDMLGECCSKFEEDTLKENLQEEFKLYLNNLHGVNGLTKGE